MFSPCLIITFFEQKALCCLFGVMGTPAGLDKTRTCLRLLMFFSLSLRLLVCDSLPLKVTDSSMRRSDGTAGRMIDTQTLKEFQTHISHLRELGHTAAERLNQVQGLYHGCLSENMYDVTCDTWTVAGFIYSRPEVPTCGSGPLKESWDKSEGLLDDTFLKFIILFTISNLIFDTLCLWPLNVFTCLYTVVNEWINE